METTISSQALGATGSAVTATVANSQELKTHPVALEAPVILVPSLLHPVAEVIIKNAAASAPEGYTREVKISRSVIGVSLPIVKLKPAKIVNFVNSAYQGVIVETPSTPLISRVKFVK